MDTMDTMDSAVYVGIDVAKAQVDIAVRPSAEQWVSPHDEAGISALVARLQRLQPALIVLEATGGREAPLAAALATAGLAVAVVNPLTRRAAADCSGRSWCGCRMRLGQAVLPPRQDRRWAARALSRPAVPSDRASAQSASAPVPPG